MRAVGSERIRDNELKLKRILEISGVEDHSELNESEIKGRLSTVLHEAKASDGTDYAIVQEGKYVYIKVDNGNGYEYISGVQNIHEHSYKHYADALKNLNLMFKQINESVGHEDNVNIFKKKRLTKDTL